MKFKTTKKAIMEGYPKTVCVGYCDLQHLLYFNEPIAYTCGVYGWNADIYDFGNIAIIMGYRPFGEIRISYDSYRKYDDKARSIIYDYNTDYETRKKKVQKLLQDFLKKEC